MVPCLPVAWVGLKKAGAAIVAPPESFFVTRDDPPVLLPGEMNRAKSWAQAVVG